MISKSDLRQLFSRLKLMIARQVRPSGDPLIYNNLLLLAKGVLEHYKDDLYLHDRKILTEGLPLGSSWLWIVHKCGTHMARWDQDPFADTKDSHVESLVRCLSRGDWSGNHVHLFHVNGFDEEFGAIGWVSGRLEIADIEEALPRPLPPKAPHPQEQAVYSAHVGLAAAFKSSAD